MLNTWFMNNIKVFQNVRCLALSNMIMMVMMVVVVVMIIITIIIMSLWSSDEHYYDTIKLMYLWQREFEGSCALCH
jgi:hypothetical protein